MRSQVRRSRQHRRHERWVPSSYYRRGPDKTLFEGEAEAPRVEVHAEFVLRASARAAREPLVQFVTNEILKLVLHPRDHPEDDLGCYSDGGQVRPWPPRERLRGGRPVSSSSAPTESS